MRILVNEYSDRNLLERRLTNQSEEAWKSNEVCLKYWNGEVSSSGLWEENFRDSICWYKLPFFWAKKNLSTRSQFYAMLWSWISLQFDIYFLRVFLSLSTRAQNDRLSFLPLDCWGISNKRKTKLVYF